MSADEPDLAARAAALTQKQWPLIVVLVLVLVGLGLVWWSWPIGCMVIAGALCLGALLRLVLPRREAGLLVVRGRTFDVAFLAACGLGLLALVLSRI